MKFLTLINDHKDTTNQSDTDGRRLLCVNSCRREEWIACALTPHEPAPAAKAF